MVIPKRLQLRCFDNSGIKKAYTINYLFLQAGLGLTLASVSQVSPHKKVKKGDLLHLVITNQGKKIIRLTGTTIQTTSNGAIWLKKDGSPSASRIFGSCYLEARYFGYTRLLVVSAGIL